MAQPAAEHRLAIVMNGGVSLAVWMGGVARELDNVRRASCGLPGPAGDRADPSAAAERTLFERWQAHVQDKGVRVRVDVIAGASAGGLNGILLAMAIANGAPLDGLRELWQQTAQLSTDKLLRPQPEGPLSVLNGDFFLERIEDALKTLKRPPSSDQADVALTVTATALGGSSRLAHDATGTPFREPDHRRRFEFLRIAEDISYDGAEFHTKTRDDFVDTATLARSARASASFPVAFAPVDESPELRRRRSWPDWHRDAPLDWLADGGILDNSPFDPVLQAISRQPVESTWHRTLCYVVPSADEAQLGEDVDVVTDPAVPPPWTSVGSAALGLPRESDLRDDFEELHDSLRGGRTGYDVGRFRLLLRDAEERSKAIGLATAAFSLYRQNRAAAAIYEICDLVATAGSGRYLQPSAAVDPAEVTGSHPWLPDAFPTAIEATWQWGLDATTRVVGVLLRSLSDVGDVSDQLRTTLTDIKLRVAALRAHVFDRIGDGTLDARSPTLVRDAVLLADKVFAETAVTTVLASLVRDAVSAYAGMWTRPAVTATEVLQSALCVEVVNGAGGVPVETKARPLFDFMRMGISAVPALFTQAQNAANKQCQAKTGKPSSPSNLLYGTRLHHFGAFGRTDWRTWDWMWGRLNATVHLGALLGLPPDDVDELARLVVAAEGRTVDDVSKELTQVVCTTASQFEADLRQDGTITPALDAVFNLLGSTRRTEPRAPRALRWVATLGARQKPAALAFPQRLARIATALPRWQLHRKLGG